MDEYEKQANDFLKKTKTTLTVRYNRTGKYFSEDIENRDIYDVTLERMGRSYTFTFGDSIHNFEERIKTNLKGTNNFNNINYFLRETEGKTPGMMIGNGDGELYKGLKQRLEWEAKAKKMMLPEMPNAYSILACLQHYEPEENIDEFAEAMGYEKPSVALSIYEKVWKQYTELQKLFNEEEMQMLSEIS